MGTTVEFHYVWGQEGSTRMSPHESLLTGKLTYLTKTACSLVVHENNQTTNYLQLHYLCLYEEAGNSKDLKEKVTNTSVI